MFTGIIERMARVAAIERRGGNVDFWIESDITQELQVDQSVAHNGVCLTVAEIKDNLYRVTAVAETLAKTTLGIWQINDRINLERSLTPSGRMDGHLVQGHVDGKALCTQVSDADGSKLFRFSFPENFAPLMIEKGSVCINGVSLTCFNVGKNEFTVTIIPYTLEHTNFSELKADVEVNIEFDVVGKYLQRAVSLQAAGFKLS